MSAGRNVFIGSVVFALTLTVAQSAGATSNRIHGVRISTQGKATIVEISGERAPNFTTFKQDSPRRVIVDVAESDLGSLPGSIHGDGDVVSGVTTAQYGSPPHGISRFIISLNREAEYRVTTQGGSLYVHITPGTGGLLVSAGVPVAPKRRSSLSTGSQAAGSNADLDLPLDVEPSAEADAENTPGDSNDLAQAQDTQVDDSKSQNKTESDAASDESTPAPVLVAMTDTNAGKADKADAPDNSVKETQPSPVKVAQSDDEVDDTAESDDTAGDDTADVEEVDEADSVDEEADSEDVDEADDEVPVSDDVDDSSDTEEVEPPPPPPPASEDTEEEVPPPPPASADTEEEVPPPPPAAETETEEEVPEAPASETEEEVPPPPSTAEESTEEVPEAPAANSSDYSEVEDRVEVSGALKDMTWVGFQQTMEASRVFIKTNEPVKFHVTEEGDNMVVLELENTRIPLKNNTRFLDTHFFDSAVTMINPREIEGVSRNVRIEIQLRGKVPYTAGQDANMVYLDFRRQ